MAIKIIAIDWNGTGMNDNEIMYEVIRRHVELGLREPPSVPEILRTYESPYLDYLRSFGSVIPESQNWHMWDHVTKEFGAPRIVEGLVPLIERFMRRGLYRYVISANRRHRVEEDLVNNGVRFMFSGIYADSEYKEHQIRKILETHDVNPEEMVYLGDMRVDMQAAKIAGVVGVGIGSARGHEAEHQQILKEAGASVTFPSLAAFHDALIRGDL